MKVDLLYGKSGITIECADHLDVTVIRKPEMPLVADAGHAVRDALEQPTGSTPLASLASGCASACILVCDITRPVPNALFLRPMIEQMQAGGIPLHAITVLVATGLHRPNEGAELQSVIGDQWVLDHVRVENHYARNDADHVDLGVTSTGTPIKLDRRFVDSDLKVATGLVEPHFMAGYSGGRKVVAPGIAHADTIRTFHSARFMEDPLAVQCVLAGNPLHTEQIEIIERLRELTGRGVYALNTVIDEARRLSFVNFGEIEASHLAAVDHVHGYCTVRLPRRFSTVVTSAAGFPLDQTYYQTVKGMVTPLDILAEDGTLIVASDCSEGIGSDAYRESQRRLLAEGADGFLARILDKTLADIDEWETEMQLKSQRVARVQLYSSGLEGADRSLTGVELIASVEDAIARSVATSGDKAVAVIPEGPYVVPLFDAASTAR